MRSNVKHSGVGVAGEFTVSEISTICPDHCQCHNEKQPLKRKVINETKASHPRQWLKTKGSAALCGAT